MISSSSAHFSYCAQCNAVKTEEFNKTIAGRIVKKTQQLSLCSKCNLTFYCSPECQKKDWPTHKITCLTKSVEFVSVEKVRNILERHYIMQTGRIIVHLDSNKEYLNMEESKETSIDLIKDKLFVDVKIENRLIGTYKFLICQHKDDELNQKSINGLECLNPNNTKKRTLPPQELLIGLSSIADCVSKDQIKHNDGTLMTSQDVFLKMIESVPTSPLGFHNLACTMQKNDKIVLNNGTTMTKHQLHLKAIELEPNNPEFYYGLVDDLSYNDTIRFNSGASLNAIQFLVKVIELDPHCDELYHKLGFFLPVHGSVKLKNGNRMTKQELYLKAIELNPNGEQAYYRLANILSAEGTVKFNDGTIMTALQLCLKAFQLNPKHPDAYYNIACTLPNNGTMEFQDGSRMTQQQLFLKDIELNAENFRGYQNLGSLLPLDGTIELKDGTIMTKHKLLLKGIELFPTSPGYYALAYTLPRNSNETVLFKDGTRMTREQLILKGQSLESSKVRYRKY